MGQWPLNPGIITPALHTPLDFEFVANSKYHHINPGPPQPKAGPGGKRVKKRPLVGTAKRVQTESTVDPPPLVAALYQSSRLSSH